MEVQPNQTNIFHFTIRTSAQDALVASFWAAVPCWHGVGIPNWDPAHSNWAMRALFHAESLHLFYQDGKGPLWRHEGWRLVADRCTKGACRD